LARPQSITFLVGQLYNRRSEIHAVYGGQQQGGIVTPQACPFIFLFTGEAGEQHGYSDGWRAEGVFAYTREGQRGNMEFARGNRAIRDHVEDGKDLLLFEATSTKGSYRYRGCFECTGWETGIGPDTNGELRSTIVFLLVPVTTVEAEGPSDGAVARRERSLEELKALAEQAASAAPVTGKDSRRVYYQRSAAVRAYVLARARGYCEGCQSPAPFERPTGEPYLEPHHVTRVSDGGPDHPRHVIALCPTCHRKVHFGREGLSYNAWLKGRLGELAP
jgi:5-methylcytosine-specific restriction protein A